MDALPTDGDAAMQPMRRCKCPCLPTAARPAHCRLTHSLTHPAPHTISPDRAFLQPTSPAASALPRPRGTRLLISRAGAGSKAAWARWRRRAGDSMASAPSSNSAKTASRMPSSRCRQGSSLAGLAHGGRLGGPTLPRCACQRSGHRRAQAGVMARVAWARARPGRTARRRPSTRSGAQHRRARCSRPRWPSRPRSFCSRQAGPPSTPQGQLRHPRCRSRRVRRRRAPRTWSPRQSGCHSQRSASLQRSSAK